MKQAVLITVMAIGTAIFTGCYTQLTTIDRSPPPQPQEQVEWVVDSATGDTIKVVKQVDTIHTEDNQTCIWERDLMGYPHLRCYDSFYPRDWFYYNNSPWWYRNDPYWYDYSRCPRYYYYDPSCGCCRYTADFYHSGGRRYYDRDGIKVENREPSGPSGYRSRVRGVPDPGTAGPAKSSSKVSSGTSTQSSKNTTNNNTIVTPPDENGKTTVIVNDRRRGVPAAGTAAPVTSSSKTTGKKASSGTSTSSSKSTPSVTPSTNSSQQQSHPTNRNDERRPRRRNPRSW